MESFEKAKSSKTEAAERLQKQQEELKLNRENGWIRILKDNLFRRIPVAQSLVVEIRTFGDSGADFAYRMFQIGLMPRDETAIIVRNINTDHSMELLCKVMAEGNAYSESLTSWSGTFEFLRSRDNPKFIPILANWAKVKVAQFRTELLQDKRLGDGANPDRIDRDLQELVKALTNFSDRRGFEEAQKIYEEVRQIGQYFEANVKAGEPRLPSFYEEDFGKEYYGYPSGISEEDLKNLRKSYKTKKECGWDVLNDPEFLRFYETHGKEALLYVKEIILSPLAEVNNFGSSSPNDFFRMCSGIMRPEELEKFIVSIISQTNTRNLADLYSDLEESRISIPDRCSAEIARRFGEFCLNGELSKKENNDIQINFRFHVAQIGDPALQRQLQEAYPDLFLSLTDIEELSPVEQQKTNWKHKPGIEVGGLALMADVLGRGKEKVGYITVRLTAKADSQSSTSFFDKIEDLQNILDPQEIAQLTKWMEDRGYSGKKIRLTIEPDFGIRKHFYPFRGFPLVELRADKSEALKLPEKLIPFPDLACALITLNYAERLGLEYDPMILNEAEKAARNGSLKISAEGQNVNLAREEGAALMIIGPEFMEVFQEQNLRKILLRNFPRLGQLAEEIAGQGSIENYIRNNYGAVYLRRENRTIQLYDINLSRSPASQSQQLEFLADWGQEIEDKDAFIMTGVEKTGDSPDLPKPESLEKLIDKKRYKMAIKNREEKPHKFLDQTAGRYRLVLNGNESAAEQRKVEAFLKVMNLDWPANIPKDKAKVSQTLIKLGVHPHNPILSQFGVKRQQEVDLVISADPKDILQASTEKNWTSCINLKGGAYRNSLYDDIANANAVAYLMQGSKFVARKLIRLGFTVKGKKPAAAIEKTYGDSRFNEAMRQALDTIFMKKDILVNAPMFTYPNYSAESYADSYSDRMFVDRSRDKMMYIYGVFGGGVDIKDIPTVPKVLGAEEAIVSQPEPLPKETNIQRALNHIRLALEEFFAERPAAE